MQKAREDERHQWPSMVEQVLGVEESDETIKDIVEELCPEPSAATELVSQREATALKCDGIALQIEAKINNLLQNGDDLGLPTEVNDSCTSSGRRRSVLLGVSLSNSSLMRSSRSDLFCWSK